MSPVNYINACLQIWGCTISVIAAACLLLTKRQFDRFERLYFWILGCNTCALFFDMLALLFRGHPGLLCWWGVRVSNFVSFSANYCLLESFSDYLTSYLARRTAVSRRPLQFTRWICLFSLGFVVLTQFVPVIYTIDARNVYHRADWFWLSQVAGLAAMLINAGMLLRYRSALEPLERAALWTYILLPAAALVVQIFVYGLALLNLADTVAIIVIFLFLQAEQGRRSAEQENLLMQDRVAIMLSQIQPHFLYNALSVIQDLCHGKAPEAEQAAVEFSEFLRGNLDSLQADSPIPFEQELRHTQNYLSLEKKRFGDNLRVEYEIGATDFFIPALTLQPIVENAVRNGVMRQEEGGTVRVASAETAESFTVTVSDDGIGFDPAALPEDGRTHVGISNVRERLRVMSGGSLHIESARGMGTTAVLSVPKTVKSGAQTYINQKITANQAEI